MAGYVSVEYLRSICLYRYLIGGNNKIPQRYTRGCDQSAGQKTSIPEEIVGHGEHREHCCCVPIGVGHTEQGYGDVH